jgi:hypothetical protein
LNVALDRQVDTFEDACEAMYRTMAKIDDDSDGKLNLGTKNRGKKQNKQNARSDDDSQGSQSDDDDGGSCPHCGRAGHDPDACWMLKKNKKKHPDWFDTEKYSREGKKNNQNGHCNSEVSAVGQSGRGSGVELHLSSMSFPNS